MRLLIKTLATVVGILKSMLKTEDFCTVVITVKMKLFRTVFTTRLFRDW